MSVLNFIRRSEDDRQFNRNMRLLENIVYDAMCSMVYLGQSSQYGNLSGRITLPDIEAPCETEHLLEHYIRDMVIFRKLFVDFGTLSDKYKMVSAL